MSLTCNHTNAFNHILLTQRWLYMIRYWSHLNLVVAFLHYTSTISVQYFAAFIYHKPYVWHAFRNHATRYIYPALLETPGASLTNNWNGYYVLCSYYNEQSRHSCYLDPSLIGSHVIAWPRLWPTHTHRHGWTKKWTNKHGETMKMIISEGQIWPRVKQSTACCENELYRGWYNPHMPRYSFNRELRMSLQWRHNGRDSVSNHQPHDCLLNRLFRRRSKKISKLRFTGLVRAIHRGPVHTPHKWPVTRKMFPFDDVIMLCQRTEMYEPLLYSPTY